MLAHAYRRNTCTYIVSIGQCSFRLEIHAKKNPTKRSLEKNKPDDDCTGELKIGAESIGDIYASWNSFGSTSCAGRGAFQSH